MAQETCTFMVLTQSLRPKLIVALKKAVNTLFTNHNKDMHAIKKVGTSESNYMLCDFHTLTNTIMVVKNLHVTTWLLSCIG